MTVAIQQVSPVAHLPLVLGVLRKLNVAPLIATFCPPHPAHIMSWGFLPILPHAAHGMRGDMPSPGSRRVAPGKPRLPQPFQASPGDTAPHDPETPCRTPERHEGGEQALTWSRIQQSVHNEDQIIPMYPSRWHTALGADAGPGLLALPHHAEQKCIKPLVHLEVLTMARHDLELGISPQKGAFQQYAPTMARSTFV